LHTGSGSYPTGFNEQSVSCFVVLVIDNDLRTRDLFK
jgi:hypothetical protein